MTRYNDDEEHLVGLLRRIAQGDEDALREFMYRFNTRIYRRIRDQLRSDADAEEVVADTFEAVWKSAHTFQGRSSVAVWVIGIADRRVLMKLRGGRRHEGHDDVDEFSETLQSEFPDPSELVLAKEHQEFFKDCFAKLSPAHRESLMLQFVAGLSDAEIADTIGKPLGTAKTRLLHARQNMTRCIQRKLLPAGKH